ncbi:MAG: phosphoenolpyruvate-utilizing N-terminal domain-containing protein, partial [Pygmaiobacter sp.]
MLILKGRGVAGGIVCGKIIFYDRSVPEVKKTLIVDREAERLRFECARKQACDELDALNAHALESIGEQEAEIFEIHRMMLD